MAALASTNGKPTSAAWPPLPFEEWQETCETLHMMTQIAGKVKLELAPFLNEWWQVAFHLTARGMTTGPTPYGDSAFEINFDFIDHNLFILTADGRTKALPLISRPVADFYDELMSSLHTLGIEVSINTVPDEVPNPIRCDQDRTHVSYDAEYVHRFWHILMQIAKVLDRYRSSFVGKSSPIQFFWGSFDLNEARYSGRPAPVPSGPRFYQLAEDQENVACGFWPGNINSAGVTLGEPAFYSYAYPAPSGFEQASVRPGAARYDSRLGEFLLPYKDARLDASPERAILDFFQSTYEAAASLGQWDRQYLEMEVSRKSAQEEQQ